jgi:hypothetical protein
MFCRFCGGEIGDTVTVCPHCTRTPLRTVATQDPLGNDPAMRLLIPVGRSLWAIAAGYAGLFALLVFPAPLALILGIIAIRDMKLHPEKHGMGRAVFGLVTGALGTCVLLMFIIIGLVGP